MTPKHTKLEQMIGDALDREPESNDVSAVIEATAQWFELLLGQIGVQPSAIPALLRWQYLQRQFIED
jgi:hypothetical protein